jgi:molybdopterin-guanine dinucleotide biosynthesis protein A
MASSVFPTWCPKSGNWGNLLCLTSCRSDALLVVACDMPF